MKTILFVGLFLALLLCSSSSFISYDIEGVHRPTITAIVTCNRIDLTVNNRKGVEMKGCVLIGYESNGTEHKDGARPIKVEDGIKFSVTGTNMTHWRWVAAVDYSDEPENTDVVLMDTKKRPLEKCWYEITARGSD